MISSDFFDADFYAESFSKFGKVDKRNALDHYSKIGWRVGADPHPEFSTNAYLALYVDVREAEVNPLEHFEIFGRGEGRIVTSALAYSQWKSARKIVRRADYFDFDFYCAQVPSESFGSIADGLDHYLQIGWREGLDPHPEFSTNGYLSNNPDIKDAGIDPLTHFVRTGFKEGRSSADRSRNETNLERVLRARTVSENAVSVELIHRSSSLSLEDLKCVFRGYATGEPNRVVVSFGHDDYRQHFGGVQLICAREEIEFNSQGDVYVSVFPLVTRLTLAPLNSGHTQVRCRINGSLVEGSFELHDLAKVVRSEFADASVSVIMHSIYGHSPEEITNFLGDLEINNLIWWIHDYSLHCENFRLTRNDVHWCGDPDPSSQSCSICTFGPNRQHHLERVRKLVDSFNWSLVAPSETAANQSISGNTPLSRLPEVIPHGEVQWDGRKREPIDPTKPVRIAFVGHPLLSKGWHYFLEFIRNAGELESEFEFFHFGAQPKEFSNIRFVEARPSANGISIVTSLLISHQIDAVVNFVDVKETFNFVTYEAIAAGCCVMASRQSGNVFEAAAKEGLLIECPSESGSFDYERIVEEIRSKRRDSIGEFVFTGLSPGLLSGSSNVV